MSMAILFAMFLTSGKTLQAFATKKGTATLDTRVLAMAQALLSVMFFWGMKPFLPSLWAPDAIAVLVGMLGGVAMFYCTKQMYDVRKESNSASMFISFIALGIAAPINTGLLGEGLTAMRLATCVGIGLLGGVFFLCGAASELSTAGKKAFVLSLFWFVLVICTDRFVIARTNWYMNGIITETIYFLVALFSVSRAKLKLGASFRQPILWYCGIIYVLMTILTMYSSGEVLGVSITHVFLRLSTPIVMVLSAYTHGERTPREQLIFGALAFLLALPLVLK